MVKFISLLGGDEKTQIEYKNKLTEVFKDANYSIKSSPYFLNVSPKCDFYIIYNNYDKEHLYDIADQFPIYFVVFQNYTGNILEHMENKIIYEIEEPDIEIDSEIIFDKMT